MKFMPLLIRSDMFFATRLMLPVKVSDISSSARPIETFAWIIVESFSRNT